PPARPSPRQGGQGPGSGGRPPTAGGAGAPPQTHSPSPAQGGLSGVDRSPPLPRAVDPGVPRHAGSGRPLRPPGLPRRAHPVGTSPRVRAGNPGGVAVRPLRSGNRERYGPPRGAARMGPVARGEGTSGLSAGRRNFQPPRSPGRPRPGAAGQDHLPG